MADLVQTMRLRVAEIGGCVVREQVRLDGWQVRAALHLAPGRYEPLEAGWRSLDVGGAWARPGETAFLRREVRAPDHWRGLRVGLELRTGGEGLLSVDGTARHGIDDNRGYILLTPRCEGGETWRCEAEMKPGGYLEYVSRDRSRLSVLAEARLLGIDAEAERAWYDFRVLHECAAALPDATAREALLLAMREALRSVDFRRKGEPGFGAELAAAGAALRARVAEIPYWRHPGAIFFAGHSHIDVAWLWPLRETARKVGRTYSTVTALMDEYPNYHFVCSQVPLFLYLREHFPGVYERVKERVREGRFEPVGGTWVENDCNVVSGESLVRQCLYGQRFFRDELGVDVRVGWLPDVFGYSWALPQIYRKSGIEYFMTAKVAWNERNRLPYNTFWWEGIDGSRLLTHLVHNLGNMYNAHAKPAEMLRQWEDYRSMLACPEVLCPFGYGDGGGGPTREMLEYIPRMADVPGLPAAGTGRVHGFFDRIAAGAGDLPVWNGEMYFERHRGTYTTQAWNKRCNRRAELTLREAEMLAAFAVPLGAAYPKADLTSTWHTVLLNQFHDILPGSSIREVYEDSRRDYARALEDAGRLRAEALEHIAARVDTAGPGAPVVVVNALAWPRTDLASAPLPPGTESAGVTGPDGRPAPCQASAGRALFLARDVPSCGLAVYRLGPPDVTPDTAAFQMDGARVVTPWYEVTLGPNGTLARLYDRDAGREVLPPEGGANALIAFEDKPVSDEAWDIDASYEERCWPFEAEGAPEEVEQGPVRLVLRQALRYGASRLEQRVVFYAHTPRIDWETTVDWQERKTLLKVAFPVEVRSPRATYEIAFGAIERPTHRNTSWDEARFEVSGHRWADLSEAGYGVSVLNDCKYGWDVRGSVIRLTLLRSPESPDPEADRGEHRFTYALLPHRGDWRGSTLREAHALNAPLLAAPRAARPGELPASHSFLSVDAPNVVADAVKEAEGDDALIVRLYEAHGARGPVALTFDRDVVEAVECDLLERPGGSARRDGRVVRLAVRPFEVRTLRLRLAR
ncbi:MAG: alpha-mannosidase [Chthonomonadales bacterium]|nr:alpha-mannosidase [Chthonomonadales bacterium]